MKNLQVEMLKIKEKYSRVSLGFKFCIKHLKIHSAFAFVSF